MGRQIMVYRRPQGGFGIRNYVLVISSVECSNAVVQQICNKTGATPITHDKGCSTSMRDHEYTTQALINAGRNPNIYSVLLVGLGCEMTDHALVKSEIEKSGKRCEYLGIQEMGGPPETVEAGIKIVEEMMKEAAAQKREPMDMKDLTVAVQCGGSDWTTALTGNVSVGIMADHIVENGGAVVMSEIGGLPGSEHIVASKAVTREVGLQILDMVEERRAKYLALNGHTIEEVNPTPGNKAGGITTLVEKSTGNIKKIGSCKVNGVLNLYDRIPGPGVWFLNHRTVGLDEINMTAFALSGVHILVFCSGLGTPVGHACMPCIKLTGNPDNYRKVKSLFDFNAGQALEGKSLDQVGQELFDLLIDVVEGKETQSEKNGNQEFLILIPTL